MYRAPPGAYARPVEVIDQSFIRSNDSLGRPPLYSPSLACRVVHIKPRYSSNCVVTQHKAAERTRLSSASSPPCTLVSGNLYRLVLPAPTSCTGDCDPCGLRTTHLHADACSGGGSGQMVFDLGSGPCSFGPMVLHTSGWKSYASAVCGGGWLCDQFMRRLSHQLYKVLRC